jgi:membrane associated rhomboid family serine protease
MPWCFPHARLGFLFRLFFYFRWVYLPAWGAFVLWVLLQFLGIAQQLSGFANVSALAHLGGAAVGLVFWFVERTKEDVPRGKPSE